MPSMTERLPAPLSERLATATTAIFSKQGREVDVALGGVPFRLATAQEFPHSIETIPVRKDQVDTETEPGEQSLSGWWRRAQASWHEGAGYLYQESSTSLTPTEGFRDSRGIDVFTKGRVTLLKKMVPWDEMVGINSRVRHYTTAGGNSGATWISNGALYRNVPTGSPVETHAPVGETLVDAVVVGPESHFYSIDDAGTLYEGGVAFPGSATTWPLGDVPSRLLWGKHRLWVIGGRNLWQPDLSLAAAAAQDPIFTNPNQGWTYTAAAEGPSAMLFAGHDGHNSSIQAITFDSGGGVPTLSGAAETAVLPNGELVQEIEVLAGQYIGIGTNQGFRVGIIQGNDLTYGPLIVEPEGVTGCTALTSQGRFFVVAFSTASGTALAYRVDTGTPLDGGLFPYAADVEIPVTGSITSLAATTGTQLVATDSTGDLYYQSPTDHVDSGWIESGRIRYRTTERKFFRSLLVEMEPLDGSMAVDLIREGGSTQNLGSLTAQGQTRESPLLIGGDAMRYGSVKFTFTSTADSLSAPVLNSYQLTAYPAVRPQRLITLPLLCFDKERAKSGQQYGGTGFAVDRLLALQLIENEGEVVTYQDFTMGGAGQLVMIERVRFVQTSPASNPNAATGPGGVLIVELRTVEGT